MAGNTFLTPVEITYRFADEFVNNMVFGAMIDRQYSPRFARDGGKIGNTIYIRKQPRFVVHDGAVISDMEDMVDTSHPLVVQYQKHVPMAYDSQDLAFNIDDFNNRYIRPAAQALANEVDRHLLELAILEVYNFKGTYGTRPADSAIFLDGKAVMRNEAVPMDKPWQALLAPLHESSMVKALQGLFNAQELIAEQYRRGRMGVALGLDWDVDQNMPVNTVGTLGGTPVVAGANQTGSNINTSGWTATTATLKKGNIIQFAGVFAINPLSRRTTTELRNFVVTADVAADGSGNMTIPISPPLTPPNADGSLAQYQTVTASPANSAAVTIAGAANTNSPQSLIMHPNFATAAFVDLPQPHSGTFSRFQDEQMGIAFRIWQDSEWGTDSHGTRVDVLYGLAVPYPQWACRIPG